MVFALDIVFLTGTETDKLFGQAYQLILALPVVFNSDANTLSSNSLRAFARQHCPSEKGEGAASQISVAGTLQTCLASHDKTSKGK